MNHTRTINLAILSKFKRLEQACLEKSYPNPRNRFSLHIDQNIIQNGKNVTVGAC